MNVLPGLHDIRGHLLTDQELADMRHWLDDSSCTGAADVADLSHDEVVWAVERYYPGGAKRFLAELEV